MYSLQVHGSSPLGFPHSEIHGSKPVSGSPWLIAAVHVLHRLSLPRHSPYALCSLALSLRHASRSLGFSPFGDLPSDSQGHAQDSNRERLSSELVAPRCLLSRMPTPCSIARVGGRLRNHP